MTPRIGRSTDRDGRTLASAAALGVSVAPGAIVALAAIVALVAATASVRAASAAVSIVDFAFQPDSVTVQAGSSVTWTVTRANDPHTVTPLDPPTAFVGSGLLRQGDTFVVTFSAPGTYRYICSIHPEQMRGTVVVTAAAAPAPPSATPSPTSSPTAIPTAPPTQTTTETPTATPSPPASPPQPASGPPLGVVAVVVAGAALALALLARFALRR
jgi:plastocyanin